MGENAEASDNFDFHGCLNLAHGLWSFADHFVTTDAARRSAGHTVMSTWKGRFADDAVTSMGAASTTATNAESGLRQEARTLASRWSDEWLRQANIEYMQAAKTAESHKSIWERGWDHLTGDSTYSDHPMPKRPSTPSAPGFAPTAPVPVPSYHF